MPFSKVIGVEFFPKFVERARRNLEVFQGKGFDLEKVSILEADALAYELPQEPLVIYFYNPFSKSVLEQFLDRVAASVEKTPRQVFIVYLHPVFDDVMKAHEALDCFQYHSGLYGYTEYGVYRFDSKSSRRD